MRDTWEDAEDIYDLFIDSVCAREPFFLKDCLNDIEAKIIEYAVLKENGSIKQAAMMLNMKYTTLWEKMRKYDIRIVK